MVKLMSVMEPQLLQKQRGARAVLPHIPQDYSIDMNVEFRVLEGDDQGEAAYGNVRGVSRKGLSLDVIVPTGERGVLGIKPQTVSWNHLVVRALDGKGIPGLLDWHFRPFTRLPGGELARAFDGDAVCASAGAPLLQRYAKAQTPERVLELFFFLAEAAHFEIRNVGVKSELEWDAVSEVRAVLKARHLDWLVTLIQEKYGSSRAFVEAGMPYLAARVIQTHRNCLASASALILGLFWRMLRTQPTTVATGRGDALAKALIDVAAELCQIDPRNSIPAVCAVLTPPKGMRAYYTKVIGGAIRRALSTLDLDDLLTMRARGVFEAAPYWTYKLDTDLPLLVVNAWWSQTWGKGIHDERVIQPFSDSRFDQMRAIALSRLSLHMVIDYSDQFMRLLLLEPAGNAFLGRLSESEALVLGPYLRKAIRLPQATGLVDYCRSVRAWRGSPLTRAVVEERLAEPVSAPNAP